MKILSHKYFTHYYFVFAFLLVVVVYSSAHQALLIDDGISGIWEMQKEGLKGYLRSYGFQNFYYGHYAIVALLYSLFGLNDFLWFLFFCLMHVCNALLIYLFFKKLFFRLYSNSNADAIAFFSSLLFLISPYQSENIVWAATSHYAVSLFILFFSLRYLLLYFEGKPKLPLWIFHLLFAFATVTLEISFLFPVIYGALFLLLKMAGKVSISYNKYIVAILLPQGLIVLLYCFCHYLIFSTWIPHDRAGAEVQFSFSHAVTTTAQQIVKLFGFVHFLDFSKRNSIYQLMLHWKKLLLIVFVLFGILLLIFYKRKKESIYYAMFLLFCSVCMYAPFMRLYFMYIARLENDRYNYFASAFLFTLFVFFLFQFHKAIRYFVISAYIAAFIVCLFPVVSARKHSARMHRQYLKALPFPAQNEKLFMLNVPASCRDAYMFRAEGRLGIAYEVHYKKDIFKNLVQVAWFNVMSENDEFEVQKTSDSSYHVQMKTSGSWWMYQSMGATDYETDYYIFKLGQWDDYEVHFKRPLSVNDKILLYTKGHFVNVR